MQALALRWRREGVRVGFVPTMGYLHEGHMSLVRRARRDVGEDGVVVVSVYVNPTQFAANEDLSRYPRDLGRDRRLCREEGVDVMFVPDDGEMYWRGDAAGEASTYVVEELLVRGMEGASRPTHFRGVTTVVAKLFHLVAPDVAVFGAKDYQQAAVVKRMVRDLFMPVDVVVAPTVREADGLAMSSRNAYLTAEERGQAVVLHEAIGMVRRCVRGVKRPVLAERLRGEVERLVGGCSLGRLDYVAFVDAQTLEPLERVGRGAQMALAVWFGRTRLIDNGRL